MAIALFWLAVFVASMDKNYNGCRWRGYERAVSAQLFAQCFDRSI